MSKDLTRLFLTFTAAWAVVIASATNIAASSPNRPISPKSQRPLASRTDTIDYSALVAGLSAPQDQEPAISVWRGPVQPLFLKKTNEAQIVSRIPTTQPVVFVGIDDGWVQTQENLDWLTSRHLPFSLFLTNNGIKNNYTYFDKLRSAGMEVQNHTISHADLTKLDYKHQKHEICATSKIYAKVYGHSPTLFRPPYGAYNEDTRKAAADCGLKAIVLWRVVIGADKTGDEQFQSKNHLQPGDIVLIHFKKDMLKDMRAFAEDAAKNHLQVGRLEDWIL